MKAFVQTGIGRFERRDVPQPHPARGEVVLRVRAALTCGTDRKLLERGHSRIALPVTMGHEACGEIEAATTTSGASLIGHYLTPFWRKFGT